jgi:hypothetical protein
VNADRLQQIRAICNNIEYRVQAKHLHGIDPDGAMRTVIEAFAEMHVDALKEIELSARAAVANGPQALLDVHAERVDWYAP